MALKARDKIRWALLGAATRLAQIEKERAEIVKAFPAIRHVRADVLQPKVKRPVSAKARRAMTAGMRRYWADRKARELKRNTRRNPPSSNRVVSKRKQ